MACPVRNAALIGSLTAILERQQAAVSWAHRQLEQLRDRAAQPLAAEMPHINWQTSARNRPSPATEMRHP